MSEPHDLPDDVRGLLEAERTAAPAAPDGSRDRVRKRVAATLGIALLASPAVTAATAPGSVGAVAGGALKWVGALVAVGVVGGGAWLASRAPVAPPAASAPRPISAAPAAATEMQAPVVAATPPPGPVPSAGLPSPALPAPPDPAANRPRHRPVEAAGEKGGDLGAEQQLLDEARASLSRGDAATALGLADRHARRFPSGQLAEARESLAVRSLVMLDRGDEARARAADFHRRYPRSALGPAVDAALAAPR